MKILLTPDSYKGSMSALQVARSMAEGVSRVFPQADVTQLPISDGGEGTVETLVSATGGTLRQTTVTGPLGKPVQAAWGILGNGKTAVLEMATAAGLTLVPAAEKDPRAATTYGVGELVKCALDAGARNFIIGIGGSATNDGGSGFARALGARFLDADGKELPDGGAALARLASIDATGLDPRLHDVEILVACDVDNPLCGERGASAVFGPQKGATPDMVSELDAALARYAHIADRDLGKEVKDVPGAGAAGGLGAGLMLFTRAKLRPGIKIVLETMQFEKHLTGADLVITGEGNTDFQTAYGKAPVGVAKMARKQAVPVICISGGLGKDYQAIYEHGISAAMGCQCAPMSLGECMQNGPQLVADATERACRLLRLGAAMPGLRQ